MSHDTPISSITWSSLAANHSACIKSAMHAMNACIYSIHGWPLTELRPELSWDEMSSLSSACRSDLMTWPRSSDIEPTTTLRLTTFLRINGISSLQIHVFFFLRIFSTSLQIQFSKASDFNFQALQARVIRGGGGYSNYFSVGRCLSVSGFWSRTDGYTTKNLFLTLLPMHIMI